jgi:rubrerythrin
MAELLNRATDAGQEVGDQIKDTATQAARSVAAATEQVRSKATDAASAAESAVDQGLDRAAEAAKGAANMLRRQADHLPGDKAADLARQAADNLAEGADSLRRTDVASIRAYLTALIWRYPAQSLAIGLMLCLAIWWARRR